MSLFPFFISSLIIILIPGTGVIYTISAGISNGKKSSIFAALGCTAGIVPHLSLSIAMSTLLFKVGSGVFTAVKIAGAMYLLCLGIGMMVSKTNLKVEGSKTKCSQLATVRRGILINLLNPKLTIFFFSFLPQYISATGKSYTCQSVILGLTFMALTLVVFVGYGVMAGGIRNLIDKSPNTLHKIQKCFGLGFIVFALQLGISS